MPTLPGCAPDYTIAFLRLIEPGLASAADSWRPVFTERAEYYAADVWKIDPVNRSTNATMECYAALWRVARGDTSNVHVIVDRITRMVRDLDPMLLPRAGRLGLCARVLEASVESLSGAAAAPALARLDSLHRKGTGWESPTGANVMLARLLEKRGDASGALAAHRRRPTASNSEFASVLPATLREEGRLAALVGDTAGAIRAYQHYLTLRDQPDAGPMEQEVRRVRGAFGLVGAQTRNPVTERRESHLFCSPLSLVHGQDRSTQDLSRQALRRPHT